MYTTIIFDFFDVIHRDPFQNWLKEQNLIDNNVAHHSSRQLDLGNISDEEFYRQLATISEQHWHEVRDSFEEGDFIDRSMLAIIQQLKEQGYKIGLLSNSSIEYIWNIIEGHGVEPLFDVITVSAAVKLAKPDRAIFHHILKELDSRPNKTIFIDDNNKNVEAAKELGISAFIYMGIPSLIADFAKHGIRVEESRK